MDMNNLESLTEEALQVNNSRYTEQKQALDALKQKEFYKTLIEEGYFKDYVFELVMALIDPSVVKNGHRSKIVEKLVAVAKLEDRFRDIGNLACTEESREQEISEMYEKERQRIERLNKALDDAQQDEQFKLLISDGYFVDYTLDQVSLVSNDNIIMAGDRTDVLEALSGISSLRNYFVDIRKDMPMSEEVEE
jgi:hypothetical protein